jgi:hypothetical protein
MIDLTEHLGLAEPGKALTALSGKGVFLCP